MCEVGIDIYLRRTRNIWLSPCPLSRNTVTSSVYGRHLYRTLPISDEGQNSICSQSKAWFSLNWSARNPHLLSDVASISYVPFITQMGYEILKMRVAIHLRSECKWLEESIAARVIHVDLINVGLPRTNTVCLSCFHGPGLPQNHAGSWLFWVFSSRQFRQ